MKAKFSNTDHLVMRQMDNVTIPEAFVFTCAHCGATLPVPRPMSLRILGPISEEWMRIHEHCPPVVRLEVQE